MTPPREMTPSQAVTEVAKAKNPDQPLREVGLRSASSFLIALSLFMVACGPQRARMDLEKICRSAEAALPQADPVERAVKFATPMESHWYRSLAIYRAFEAIALANPSQRYELLKQAGEDEGVKDWDCPALKEIWPEPVDKATTVPAN